jgi:hypothetical protein
VAVSTEETVSVSLTKEEVELILGTFEEQEFDEETVDEEEDEDGETIEVEKKSESVLAGEIEEKLRNALRQFG